jgi:non-ribosomal peptide synthetase component F
MSPDTSPLGAAHLLAWSDDDPEHGYPRRFERQVELHGARDAVVTAGQRCSYASLNERANRLAWWLLEHRGPGSEPVLVLMDDYVDIYTAWLGVLKAGKFFCALEPRDPPARHLSIMREFEQAPLLVDDALEPAAREHLGSAATIVPLRGTHHERADNPQVDIDAAALYSVAFTSGSTGRPKGVCRTHRGAVGGMRFRDKVAPLRATDRYGMVDARAGGFAISALTALANGAAVHLYDLQQNGFAAMQRWLRDADVTYLNVTPSLFRAFANELDPALPLPALRCVQLAGEPVFSSDLELFKRVMSPPAQLVNAFGLLETGLMAFYVADHGTHCEGPMLPCGHAGYPDYEITQADNGEMRVRSRYLARGYWNDETETSRVFNFEPDDMRTYRTGDVIRLASDDTITHLGRLDHSVKIRGFTVSLVEVECALSSLPGVRQAAVVAAIDRARARQLLAFVAGEGTDGVEWRWREQLAQTLPEAMVPAWIVRLDSLPTIAHSPKVDRHLLARRAQELLDNRDGAALARADIFEPAHTPLETWLVALWERLLDVRPVGLSSDFYRLGGNSLLAARMWPSSSATAAAACP